MLIDILLIIVFGIVIFFIIEFMIKKIVFSVREKFSWLITGQDEIPSLSKTGLAKFIPQGFDSELGWVRKPLTSNQENGKYSKTEWNINKNGIRANPSFDNLNSLISCYGDSFTFSRQVNDDETWEHYLSKKLKTNVKNFAVGNYGIDQSLLRLKRDFHDNRTPIVILAVVPDTISRIVSIWKHYYEYGNTFGFKPRFVLKNDKLELKKNPIDNESKFSNYQEYIDEIRSNDFFYGEKFKREKIFFPYCLTIFKNTRRNFSLIYWVLKINSLKKQNKDVSDIEWHPMKIIMNINLQWRVKLFEDLETKKLLKKIIEEYVTYSKINKFKAVFAFLPQKDDLLFIKTKYNYYEDFLNELSSIDGLHVIDLTDFFVKTNNLDLLFSDANNYGGHYSKEGNKLVADTLCKQLKKLKIMN